MAELATAGIDTIGVRVPSHPVAHAILAAFGRPVAAPSANRSGHVSPTAAGHVLADLRGRIELIIDGGPTPMGLESTIIACLDVPTLLRPGALPRAAIERVVTLGEVVTGSALGVAESTDEDAALIAPGITAVVQHVTGWTAMSAEIVQNIAEIPLGLGKFLLACFAVVILFRLLFRR